MAYGTAKVDTLQTSTKTVQVDDLAVSADLGTAAAEDVGTAAGNVVQLDGSARLPAVDGSQLTGLPGAVGTDLSYTASTRVLASSTGADATLPEATTSEAGLLSAADKTKLNGIAAADAAPQALGVAAVGVSTDYAREDHVHAMPSAGDVGADPAGTASSAVSSHEAAADPHPGYALESSLGTAAALDVGTSAGNVVQLDGSGALPAVDGSNLTGITAGGTPGGTTGQVQYNDGGSFAGDSGLAYSATTGALTVGGKTVSADAPVLNLSQTWNNAGVTFTGLKLNVTNTASASASNLLDLQVGGARVFACSANSGIRFGTPGAGNYGISFPSGIANLLDYDGNTIASWQRTSTAYGLNLLSTKLSWGPNYFTADISLQRTSAGVVKVTNGSTGTGYIKQDPVAVSALPSAATVGAGTRGFVNDANATTFASVVAGGGANVVPVYSDGTNWRIG